MKAVLAFLCGCCWLMQLTKLPNFWLLGCVGLGLFVVCLSLCSWWRVLVLMGGWFLLGMAWQARHCEELLRERLAADLIKRDIKVTGVISGIPVCDKEHCQFQFTTEAMHGERRQRTLQLSWYQVPKPVQVGERWEFIVRLKPPFGSLNPGAFDAQAWYWQQHISAKGYVRSAQFLNLAKGQAWTKRRSRLLHELQQALPEQALLPVLAALSIGWTYDISFEQRQVVQRTGTAHLLAISGLHVGLIVGMVFVLMQQLWSWLPRIPLWLPAPTVAGLVAIVAAFCYSALAGFACSTQRACVMCTVLLLAKITRRHCSSKTALIVALWCVLWLDPCVVLSASFWLSFVAVFILIWSPMLSVAGISKWRSYLAAQWVCWIGLMPLSVWYFQQISLVSMLANMVAIPWVGTVVVPLSLLGTVLLDYCTWLGRSILLVADKLLAILWCGMAWLSKQNWAVWQLGLNSQVLFAIFLIGCFCCVLLPTRRYLGVLGIVPVFWPYYGSSLAAGEVKVTVLDVGQGLACVVRTATHVLVYDTGAKLSPRYDVGRGIVAPFLLGEGVRGIDTLVVSHGDNDHAGGAKSLLETFPTKQFYTSAKQRFKNYHPLACSAGLAWEWDGVRMQFLHPTLHTELDSNNKSCVLKITGRYGSALFVGDIERVAELQLVDRMAAELESSALIVPHHGSSTSSSQLFLSAVDPDIALFSYGYLNRYRHPSKQVVQRYQDRGVNCVDTVSGGALTLLLGSKTQIIKYRDSYHQFWRKMYF